MPSDVFSSEVDRITAGNAIARPPVTRDRLGRWQRADVGEWDWFYGLPASEQNYIRAHHMSAKGVEPDVVATWHGSDVDDVMGAWARAVAAGRRRAVASTDPLSDSWDDVCADDEPPSHYGDDMASELDLVGPVEVAQRAGVTRSAVTQWRKRYADFPAPLAVIGSGRQGPRGGEVAGTPVWSWPAVAAWLASPHDRRRRRS